MMRAIAFLTCLAVLAACDSRTDDVQLSAPPPAGPAAFVGSDACRDCHAAQFTAWQGSHHQLAMQPATEQTVLGDFADAQFEYFDTVSRFLRRNGKFVVVTDAESGASTEFEVTHTFGVEPLQQYLVQLPGGRLQALSIAWDTRPAGQGGQRWFHLYPDEFIAHDDLLHWTGREQNWNYMCAECHSTNLEKNYDTPSDSFATTWSEVNIGCEGCHGPASVHIALATSGTGSRDGGFELSLDDHGYAAWEMDPQLGIAARSEPRMQPPRQPEACGRCHARRSVVAESYEYGLALADTHLPSLLDDPLYHADGQIRGEVYVYGSFLQSRMYRAGVTCTDCHNPHSARLKTGPNPNDVCSTCHLPEVFAGTAHRKHPGDTPGCVDCHMTATPYMVIDPRRDHSFRIPRPDLSAATGAPNACTSCHSDRDADWAASMLLDWFGEPESGHFALALLAARSGDADANRRLHGVVVDPAVPGIVRGTALSVYRRPLTLEQATSVQTALEDADALVRIGALRAMGTLPAEAALRWATPLLGDPVRAVRLEAYHLLSPMQSGLGGTDLPAFERVRAEFIATQRANAERPEAQANLANDLVVRGDLESAEAAYRLALSREPRSAGARVNLADLYRRMQRDNEAETLLLEGLALDAGNASLHHSLGLLLARANRSDEALQELKRAVALAPEVSRYVYVYAIALNSGGRLEEAADVIAAAADRFPGDFDIGWVQVTMLRDAGRVDAARSAAEALVTRFPDIDDAQQLLRSFDAA